jgi:hypothetical protein
MALFGQYKAYRPDLMGRDSLWFARVYTDTIKRDKEEEEEEETCEFLDSVSAL